MTDDDDGFALLKSMVRKKLTFSCEQYKESHLRRRIDVRLKATHSGSFFDYIDLLNKDPAEYRQLMETLTINVTDFFRDTKTYDIIEHKVLPEIIRSKSGSPLRSIRIWSAGCSTGVEAYSIAILLHSLLKDDFKMYRISILGTDIDTVSLSRAKEGMYTEAEMKGVDENIKNRYFVKIGRDHQNDPKYQIIDELRNITTFEHQDLITYPKTLGFDAIFCRNVTIYFTRQLQERLYMDFYDSLNTGGFLVVGKMETMMGPAKNRFKSLDPKEHIYIKD